MERTRPVSTPDRPRMTRHREWTAQDDADLLHLAGSGFGADSIAWALGRGLGSVKSRLALLRRASLVGGPMMDEGSPFVVAEDAFALDG